MRESRRPVADLETMPEISDLRAFCRVVDLGSVTAAAKALGETKGTISRRVSRLEAGLGAPLLRRQGRRVEPTEEGRLYREKAGVALDVLEDAAASLRAADAAPSGHLRVTTALGIGSMLFPLLLPPFLEAYPGVTVEVLLTDAVLSFREHRVDVALRLSQGLPDSSLVAHPLFRLEPVLVASPAYLARRGAPATPHDLARHDTLLIPVQPGGQRFVFEAPDGSGTVEVLAQGRVLSHDPALLRDLAIAGAGITGLLPQMAEVEVRAGRLVRVLPDWAPVSRTTLYLMHAGGAVPPKVRAFRDHVREAIRAMPTRCPG